MDPDPNPAASFEERRRLFDTPGSSWNDYDRSMMSVGSDVFDRKAKEVVVSPQVREALGHPRRRRTTT